MLEMSRRTGYAETRKPAWNPDRSKRLAKPGSRATKAMYIVSSRKMTAALAQKVRPKSSRTTARHPGGDVLVVGHGLALGAWLATLDPAGLVALPNASVSTVTVEPDGTARLLSVGVDVAGQGSIATRPVPSAQTVGA